MPDRRWDCRGPPIRCLPRPSRAVRSRRCRALDGSANCMAVGSSANGALAERWNGRSWSTEQVPTRRAGSPPPTPIVAGLTSVSCIGASDCIAVGTSDSEGPLIVQWNGKQWSLQRPAADTDLPLDSVSCGSRSMCVAVATATDCGSSCSTSTEVERWNGRRWSLREPPVPRRWADYALNEVACRSASYCLAIGYYEVGQGCSYGGACTQTPLIERWTARPGTRRPRPGSAVRTCRLSRSRASARRHARLSAPGRSISISRKGRTWLACAAHRQAGTCQALLGRRRVVRVSQGLHRACDGHHRAGCDEADHRTVERFTLVGVAGTDGNWVLRCSDRRNRVSDDGSLCGGRQLDQ